MGNYRERAALAWTEDSVRLVLTPSPFAKSSLYYVQEVGHFKTLPGYFTERERLDSFLIVYTVSGQGRLRYLNKTHLLQPGQFFFIDCMNEQHYESQGDVPWEFNWVHINGQSIKAYYEQYSLNGEVVRMAAAAGSPIPALLEGLISLHRMKSLRQELLANQSIVTLLTELLLSGSELEALDASMPAYLKHVLQHIDVHYQDKLTLEALARQFSVNKYHLARAFKKHIGFSPGEYMINTRITRAKALLKYTDLPVSEIADQIGIDNVSHFINLFKDRTEQTPLAFRKTWQSLK